MASGDVINSIEEYDLKDLGTKKKASTTDRNSYGKFIRLYNNLNSINCSNLPCFLLIALLIYCSKSTPNRRKSRCQNVDHRGKILFLLLKSLK